VLELSGLGERRPITDTDRLRQMLENATLILTARDEGRLVGIARSVTDFVYCTYLSDLAVDRNYQGMGIGRELIRQTKLHSPMAKLILISAPGAVSFYERKGLSRHSDCFFLDDLKTLESP
jgi:predicted N-acetyltransferase YhbS